MLLRKNWQTGDREAWDPIRHDGKNTGRSPSSVKISPQNLVVRDALGIGLKIRFMWKYWWVCVTIAPELPTCTAGAEQSTELRQGCHKGTAGPQDRQTAVNIHQGALHDDLQRQKSSETNVAWMRNSSAVSTRSSLFVDDTRRRLVVSEFAGTNFVLHIQGSSVLPFRMGWIGCSKTYCTSAFNVLVFYPCRWDG